MTEYRILLVDDDPDFAASTTALLQSAGHSVLWAKTGEEALRMARQDRPDLILLDVMLSERTEGFFVLQEIRRDTELKDIPVIVISSIYAECPGFRVSPEKDWLPAERFLAKPVDPITLITEVRRVVEEKGKGEGR